MFYAKVKVDKSSESETRTRADDRTTPRKQWVAETAAAVRDVPEL